MLEIVTRLSEQDYYALRDLLDRNAAALRPDVSNYARGRQRFWINRSWDLRDRQFSHDCVQDPDLWEFCLRIWPDAELGLAAYGDIGIKAHRDDSYADYLAYSVNLGRIEGWMYDRQYQGYTYGKQGESNEQVYQLKPGDVIKFNCKNRHSVINPAPERWSLNLWHVSSKFRHLF